MLNILGIIQVISNCCLILWTVMLIIFMILAAVKELFFDESEPEECDDVIEKLNKLQETVDCLASKHLDAEAMKDLQCRNNEVDTNEPT